MPTRSRTRRACWSCNRSPRRCARAQAARRRAAAAWQEFRHDLEELRVQTFAQELGTRRPVSHKRLARQLEQLAECHARRSVVHSRRTRLSCSDHAPNLRRDRPTTAFRPLLDAGSTAMPTRPRCRPCGQRFASISRRAADAGVAACWKCWTGCAPTPRCNWRRCCTCTRRCASAWPARARSARRRSPLLDGLQAAEQVWSLHAQREGRGNAEGLRRLLLAIIRDLRVVLILLSEQLVRLRARRQLPEAERRALAELTADIHAPLANRLGIWQLKWELEDLAFRYLQPETYQRIARLLDEKRGGRERFIEEAKQKIRASAGRGRHRRRGRRPAEAHLQHLEEDAAQGPGLQRAVRHPRDPRAGRRRGRLLRGARTGAPVVDAGAFGVRRLHRQAQGQRLPLAAHRGDRRRRARAGSADPHARDARARRARRRRALALQGRRQGRGQLRAQGGVDAAAARSSARATTRRACCRASTPS